MIYIRYIMFKHDESLDIYGIIYIMYPLMSSNMAGRWKNWTYGAIHGNPMVPRRFNHWWNFMWIWVWVNTYRYIFSGMNIHLPAILGFTRYQGFDPSPYDGKLMESWWEYQPWRTVGKSPWPSHGGWVRWEIHRTNWGISSFQHVWGWTWTRQVGIGQGIGYQWDHLNWVMFSIDPSFFLRFSILYPIMLG
jgi:hypothetical protein